MTREELKRKVNSVASYLTYPALDDLHAIDDHDAEQREEIRLLSEQVNVANKELLRLDKEITRLQRALSRLRHEVAGALYMRQHEIRNVIGDTNFACLEQRIRDAEQALTQEPT